MSVKRGVGADDTVIKGLGFCSFGNGSNASLVDIRDGKILRTRPMDVTMWYTPEELNIWTLKIGDKEFRAPTRAYISPLSISYKNRAYSSNRIPYPLKRVDWDPDGERNPSNRGKSKFERISWDEALDIVVSELRRQYEIYGAGSILAQQDGHGETKTVHGAHGCMTRLLELMGGCTIQARQPDSWEGWYWGAKHVWGGEPIGQGEQQNLFFDISNNCEMLLHWGCDQEATPWGWGGMIASRMSNWFSEIGIECVYICPDLNYAAAVHADKWIPVYPNTDLALQLAIAYVWITEGLYDKEYVETHTVGFDWLEYEVMGGDEGVPRTPEWASKICGVPSCQIKALARRWHEAATSIAHCNGGSYIRSCFAHEPARMEVVLLAMQGLGKPGRNQFKYIEWGLYGTPQPVPESPVKPMLSHAYQGGNGGLSDRCIPKTLIPKAILSDETLHWNGHTLAAMPVEDQLIPMHWPLEGEPRIHMVWTDSPSWTTCWNGGNAYLDALRSESIDFVLAQHPWLENECLFADIVLPSNTKFEEEDIAADTWSGTPASMMHERRAIEPRGESLSDWEIVCAIAERAGFLKEYTFGRGVSDWIEFGYLKSGLADMIGYDEWIEKEYVSVPYEVDWDKPSGFRPFCDDPENNPLKTPTGKIEIYSTNLSAHFPDDKERRPYPHWIEESEEHHESYSSARAIEYPFKLVSNHPRWRVHSQMDDNPWLREISKIEGPDGYGYEPVWINTWDAERLGISDGDVVRIFNERGWVLGAAVVTERIVHGSISQDHGARLDPIVRGVGDRAGANNTIAPSATTSTQAVGEVTSGFLVNVEKADLDELSRLYPEAFSRTFDHEGPKLSNWVIGE